jgi:hypothetical protein
MPTFLWSFHAWRAESLAVLAASFIYDTRGKFVHNGTDSIDDDVMLHRSTSSHPPMLYTGIAHLLQLL